MTSCRIAATVFFLWRQGLFHWPSPADLLLNLQQLLTELSKAMKSLHLALRFAKFSRRSQSLADVFSVDVAGQAEVGAVARLARLMTMTIRLTAATSLDGGDGAATKIPQLQDLRQDTGAMLLQARNGIRQRASGIQV